MKKKPPPPTTAGEVVEYIHGLVRREIASTFEELRHLDKKRSHPRDIEHLEARVIDLEEWRLSILSAETLGIPRIIGEHESVLPVRYFVDTDDRAIADDVEHTLELVLDDIGFRNVATYPIVKGSWFRKFFFASRSRLTPEQLSESLAKLERSAGVRALDVPQSQVDLNRADGVAKLLASIENTQSALIQIGSILIVKIDGIPIVLNLTPQELSELERMPSVFQAPTDALSAIQKLRQDDKTSSISRTVSLNTNPSVARRTGSEGRTQ